jgi:hypothetical protein
MIAIPPARKQVTVGGRWYAAWWMHRAGGRQFSNLLKNVRLLEKGG